MRDVLPMYCICFFAEQCPTHVSHSGRKEIFTCLMLTENHSRHDREDSNRGGVSQTHRTGVPRLSEVASDVPRVTCPACERTGTGETRAPLGHDSLLLEHSSRFC